MLGPIKLQKENESRNPDEIHKVMTSGVQLKMYPF